MTDGESLTYWLRLTLIPGIGGETQRKLLAAFGLPEAVFPSDEVRYAASLATKPAAFCLMPKMKA